MKPQQSTRAVTSTALAVLWLAAPALADAWRADAGGYGPVRLGMPVAALRDRPDLTLAVQDEGGDCEDVLLTMSGGGRFAVRAVSGKVNRVELSEPGQRTVRGVGSGDTLDTLLRAYRDQFTSGQPPDRVFPHA